MEAVFGSRRDTKEDGLPHGETCACPVSHGVQSGSVCLSYLMVLLNCPSPVVHVFTAAREARQGTEREYCSTVL